MSSMRAPEVCRGRQGGLYARDRRGWAGRPSTIPEQRGCRPRGASRVGSKGRATREERSTCFGGLRISLTLKFENSGSPHIVWRWLSWLISAGMPARPHPSTARTCKLPSSDIQTGSWRRGLLLMLSSSRWVLWRSDSGRKERSLSERSATRREGARTAISEGRIGRIEEPIFGRRRWVTPRVSQALLLLTS